ncbi:hypothetical protein BGZ60DRAFT_535926 [Tricladium varicosporioides]|nr:hypothetical protein BGZ60DRAFT_535926 [Hymenoscyphus varicosporioides]
MLGGGFSNFLRIQEFLLQSEREDPRQLFNRIGVISLDVDEGEAATSSSDILKKSLATDAVQISINNISEAALATKNHANILDCVSFDITTASLNIVIGPVGCGKSALLRTLLGETALSSGTIYIRTDNMAFCHQNACIPNCIIRQAVIVEWLNDADQVLVLDSSGHVSSHVDKNDIAAVSTAALTSQKRDKD